MSFVLPEERVGVFVSAVFVWLLSPPPKVKEVMFSRLSVCLSVCLCTGYLKKLWMDPDEILWTGSVCDEVELMRFG